MLTAIKDVAVADGAEIAELAGDFGLRFAHHKPFVLEPVADQIGDRDQVEAVLSGVLRQLRQTGHGAICILDLTDHARGMQSRHAREIHSGFGVASPFQHSPIAGAQRKDVAGAAQILGFALRVQGHLDRAGPIFCGDACADASLRSGINADGEGGLVGVGVLAHHQRQVEGIEPLTLHGQTDQAAGFGGHEVDLLGRCKLRRTDQVAFVFSVFVVDHHHAGPIPNGLKGLFNRVETDGAGHRWGAHCGRSSPLFIEPGRLLTGRSLKSAIPNAAGEACGAHVFQANRGHWSLWLWRPADPAPAAGSPPFRGELPRR